jgi:hypothetical protein
LRVRKTWPARWAQSGAPSVTGSGEGFIVGAALGILGIIVIGLAPASTAGMATCSRCAEKVQAAALVCRHCGAALTPTPVVKPHLSGLAIVLVIAVFGALVMLAYVQQQTDAVLRIIPTFHP